MKKWSNPIQIWFLDTDVLKSAEYQTNSSLVKSIDGCFSALISTRMYFIGIRSKKFYNYYFSKENCQNTKDQFFQNWPLQKNPSFKCYSSIISKWCRKCFEHYNYVEQCLEAFLDEYQFRFGKPHGLNKFLEWQQSFETKLDIPKANISKIILPWKALKTKWRRTNIVDGFRLQFMNSFQKDDPFSEYGSSKRDIPPFVVEYFKLDIAGQS